jgi:hypothetical protein
LEVTRTDDAEERVSLVPRAERPDIEVKDPIKQSVRRATDQTADDQARLRYLAAQRSCESRRE